MAACQLSIEIDDPSRVRTGGETITGHVVVKADSDVKCKGLDVTCCWMTHGRGNIARGDVETQTLFQGQWLSGETYRYPFKLPTATWPPTYYGTYLNVGHYVEARANLPWKFDPKAAQEFPLVTTETPADLNPTQMQKKSGSVGWIIGIIFAGLLLAAVLPLFMLLVPIAVVGGGLFWLIRVFLPRQITGPVELVIEPDAVTPGESIGGRFEFMPKWTTKTNGIRWTITCVEQCSSGSGSNRTTHTNKLLEKVITLADSGELRASQPQKHELRFVIPAGAPPSLKFTDNEVTWTSEMRIDIPRWPDWVKSKKFVVKATASNMSAASMATVATSVNQESDAEPLVASLTTPVDDDDPWLTEVLQQIVQSEDDPERLNTVVQAVAGQEFKITIDTQGEMDEPLDAELEDEGVWISAVDKSRNARLVLCIPPSMDASQLLWQSGWHAVATIHGLDTETGRVMMQVVNATS